MEKLTLKPLSNEIIVNNGATEGAVDLFCYKPDDTITRNLGSLYVIGHRLDESSNMGYMVSLIAALARREYYSQASTSPREAFARTLRKANEVVDEFFRAGDIKLSVGIVAVASGQIMVSKLDKFKILLARENQVIDVLSNVMLFSKEHSERRRFSSIIHGSVQAGDRILAFVPTRAVTTRERNLKNLLLTLPQDEFAQRVTHLGQEHATFATAMVHIDIAQTSEPALMPSVQPAELTPAAETPSAPSLASAPAPSPTASPLPWTPRQQSSTPQGAAFPKEPRNSDDAYQIPDTEVPRIISSEFSLGTRRTSLSRFLDRLKFVRLDGRGKAVLLGVTVALITGSVLIAKMVFIGSPQKQQAQQELLEIQTALATAQEKSSEGNTIEARALLTRALASAEALVDTIETAGDLSASILVSLDTIDNAQTVQPSLIAFSVPDADAIQMATWSSGSQSIRVGGVDAQGVLWMATSEIGAQRDRETLGTNSADALIGWRSSALALTYGSGTIIRRVGDTARSYVIPVSETILDAAEFGDSIYVLTNKTILKISDLNTEKPVTKRWLTTDDQLATGAARIYVDGSIYTLSHDGTLTTYYKGKRSAQVQAPISPSGTWKLLSGPDGLLAIAVGEARRVYLVDPSSGALVRTLKVDSQLPFISISAGPNGSVLMLTSEGKLWRVQ
jgi:hypothetical protein